MSIRKRRIHSPMCAHTACQIHRSQVNYTLLQSLAMLFDFFSFGTSSDCCRFYSSLKAKCAANVNKELIDWISMQRSGPFELNGNLPTSNVFIADFVELNNFQFCRTVIALNDKIFTELMCKQQSNGCNANDNDNEPITRSD